MYDTTTTRSSAYSATTLPSGWDAVPCVQYGYPKDKGPIRAPKLNTIWDPVPEGANTASPVYLLPPEVYERQKHRENPYKVGNGYTMRATELQDECEANDRVIYPVHIESDELRKKGPHILLDWFREFVEDCLDVPFHNCRLYFSGGRSIHVHVPRVVKGERQREALKDVAETFCEETGAELDCGIYGSKRMFRLPGVKHRKTGFPKVEFDGEWDDTRLLQKIQGDGPGLPDSYADILQSVFSIQESLTTDSKPTSPDASKALCRVLDSDELELKLAPDNRVIETPSIERKKCPEDKTRIPKWAQYNDKEFSPYAHSTGNSRSVAALRVKGGAFARRHKRSGATMIPAFFYGAVGCDGEFTKELEHAPLQLSKRDYGKWDATLGDSIVIIGGRSRSSRILDVSSWQAKMVGEALNDGISRITVLKYLAGEGYDVGSAGSTSSSSSSGGVSQDAPKRIWSARSNPQSQAESLQAQAEQKGIETLTHTERTRVACRHLRQGWRPTWEWFKEQYGAEFKPEVTWTNLRNLVDYYDYENVEVPEKPV